MAAHHASDNLPPAAAADEIAGTLCRRIRRGDAGAFESLFERWFDRGVRQAMSLSRRDEAFAMDVVQEAFIKVITGIPPLQSEAAVDAWMSMTIRHAVIDALRRETSRRKRESVHRNGREEFNSATDLGAELAEMERRVAELDERDQDLLRLRFGRGLALRFLGRLFGLSAAAADGRARRALSSVRKSDREAGET